MVPQHGCKSLRLQKLHTLFLITITLRKASKNISFSFNVTYTFSVNRIVECLHQKCLNNTKFTNICVGIFSIGWFYFTYMYEYVVCPWFELNFYIHVRYVFFLSIVYRCILYYSNIINLHCDTVLKCKQTCLFHYSFSCEFEKNITNWNPLWKLTDRAVFTSKSFKSVDK